MSPRDETYDPTKATHDAIYSNSKAEKILGIKYHSIEEGSKGIVENFKGRGWI